MTFFRQATMRLRQPLLSLACILTLLAAAGSGAVSQQKGGSSANVRCEMLVETARNYVQSVINQNAGCTADAHCTVVEINTLCFDLCWRAVNSAGVSNIQRAITLANQTWCKEYQMQGCSRQIPPCLPPRPAVCKKRVCGTP